MIIAIKTDTPVAELVLVRAANDTVTHTWHADRNLARDLLAVCDEFLRRHAVTWHDLTGIVVYRGPGSFTGLRIGITVANTIAYAHHLPVVGTDSDDWLVAGCRRLELGDDDQQVTPLYGAEPRVTN